MDIQAPFSSCAKKFCSMLGYAWQSKAIAVLFEAEERVLN